MAPSQVKRSAQISPGEIKHENRRQHLAEQKCPDAETHDDNSGGQSFAVRKPFRRSRDRSDIAKPDPCPAYHAITEVEQDQVVEMEGQSANKIVRGKHHTAGRRQ